MLIVNQQIHNGDTNVSLTYALYTSTLRGHIWDIYLQYKYIRVSHPSFLDRFHMYKLYSLLLFPRMYTTNTARTITLICDAALNLRTRPIKFSLKGYSFMRARAQTDTIRNCNLWHSFVRNVTSWWQLQKEISMRLLYNWKCFVWAHLFKVDFNLNNVILDRTPITHGRCQYSNFVYNVTETRASNCILWWQKLYNVFLVKYEKTYLLLGFYAYFSSLPYNSIDDF